MHDSKLDLRDADKNHSCCILERMSISEPMAMRATWHLWPPLFRNQRSFQCCTPKMVWLAETPREASCTTMYVLCTNAVSRDRRTASITRPAESGVCLSCDARDGSSDPPGVDLNLGAKIRSSGRAFAWLYAAAAARRPLREIPMSFLAVQRACQAFGEVRVWRRVRLVALSCHRLLSSRPGEVPRTPQTRTT